MRLGKIRWRIEHDYRELKEALGLDHFEGGTWNGWHRHVTLVSAAHVFAAVLRADPDPKLPGRGLSVYALLRLLQQLLATWDGVCIVCHQSVRQPRRHRRRSPTATRT